MKFLRENVIVAGIMVLVRVVLGWSWMTAGWGKITNGFDAGGYLNNAVNNPIMDKATGEAVYPTYLAFIEKFALPNVKMINIMIPWGEFLVGVGLILGALTITATLFGLLMNFMFLFSGTVSTNPYMVVLGIIILLAGANAGKLGVDYYLLPYLKALTVKWKGKTPSDKMTNTPKVLNN